VGTGDAIEGRWYGSRHLLADQGDLGAVGEHAGGSLSRHAGPEQNGVALAGTRSRDAVKLGPQLDRIDVVCLQQRASRIDRSDGPSELG
jgi:hypothetical protein